MNWDKFIVLSGQIVVVIVLGVLVALGHNSSVTDGLLAVCGSVAGVGIYQTVNSKSKPPSS